jgi:hypothetical protein
MSDDWEQTNRVNMSVQNAEIRVPNLSGDRNVLLTCRLITIARGTCHLELCQSNAPQAGKNMLNIHVDRPVMEAVVYLAPDIFTKMISDITRSGNRPINVALTLADNLAVNVAGDLRIDEETSIEINDASFVFSIK